MTVDLSPSEPPPIEAQLLTAIHENGRLADQLNKTTADLTAERGFLANERARADQAERDRDEWRQAAEALTEEVAALRADLAEQRSSAEREALMVKLANELAETGATAQAAIAERKLAETVLRNYVRLADQKAAQARWRRSAAWVAPIAFIALCAAPWAVAAATLWWRL